MLQLLILLLYVWYRRLVSRKKKCSRDDGVSFHDAQLVESAVSTMAFTNPSPLTANAADGGQATHNYSTAPGLSEPPLKIATVGDWTPPSTLESNLGKTRILANGLAQIQGNPFGDQELYYASFFLDLGRSKLL